MTGRLRASVVIPSWNGAEILSAHLPSVLRASEKAAVDEILVSDDGSTDDTAERLARSFPDVRLVRRAVNGGFSRAANDGIEAVRGGAVVLLNNDIDVEPEAIVRLLSALEADAGLFAVVPSTVRAGTGVEEAITRLQFRRGVISTTLADGHATGVPPAYACGGAMAFRKEPFVALGGFDPVFSPFYWEDVDLSYRARKRGMRIALVPEARVLHDHGRTIGARFPRPLVERIYERNRLLFTWKNLTDPPLWRRHLTALPAKSVWGIFANRPFLAGLRAAWGMRLAIREARAAELAATVVPDRDLLDDRH